MYCKDYHNEIQRREVSKCCGKNGASRLAGCRATTDLQFVYLKKKKRQYLQNTMKPDRLVYT